MQLEFFVVGVLLIAWLMLTIVTHAHCFGWPDVRRLPILRQLVYSGLIPAWSFFAPRPGVHTYRLFYRHISEIGDVSAWREHCVLPRRSYLWSCIWNPGGRERKAIFDLCMDLTTEARGLVTEPEYSSDLMSITMPYLVCLNLVSSQPQSPATRYVQFLITRQDRHGCVTPFIVSRTHRTPHVEGALF